MNLSLLRAKLATNSLRQLRGATTNIQALVSQAEGKSGAAQARRCKRTPGSEHRIGSVEAPLSHLKEGKRDDLMTLP